MPAGPSTRRHLARIYLKGNSYERGVQYGRGLKRYLKGFYEHFVGGKPKELLKGRYRLVLESMESCAAEHFPQLVDEIKGWSDGSGLSHDMCRIMAYHNEVRRIVRGCSNIVATDGPEGPWLARNCDLRESERSTQVMKISRCDDCHSHVTITYVGIPFGLSLNSAGLAVGDASLPSAPSESTEGLPYFAAYLHATQATVRDCIERIGAVPNLSRGVHVPLLDSGGDVAAVELGAGRHFLRGPDPGGFLVATNHSIHGGMPLPPDEEPGDFLRNSRARYDRLTSLFRGSDPAERGGDFAHRVMADHAEERSVCQHGIDGMHTIYSFVAFPARGRLELCWGYPCGGKYEIIRLDW